MTCKCQDTLFPQKIHIDSGGCIIDWPGNKATTDSFIIDLPWHLKYNNDHYVMGYYELLDKNNSDKKLISQFEKTTADQQQIIISQDTTIAHHEALDFKREQQHATDSIEIKHQEKKIWWKNFGMAAGWTVAGVEFVIFAIIPKLKQ